MDKQTITIYDVAREASVSMATVSRVVNGNANVKPATRKKVLDVIEKLDYRPNAVARGLASKKTTTVGVIAPDVTNMYFASLARGIDDVATMYKYNIILTNSDSNNEKEVKVLNTLLSKQVDGIIFMGNEINDKLREEFKRTKTPIVFAGSVDEEDLYARVNIDYVAAVQEEVKNLIDRGNRRVAFVCGPLEQAINGKFRLKGYKQALKSAGIPYDEKLVFETDDTYKTGTLLQPALMAVNATAAMVTDDELAAGIMNGMSDADVKVPDDFEIITSNDTKLTEMVRPKMSSITQPLYDIGAVAMRLLTKLMHNEPVDEKNVLLPYGLMKRESTK
ncbi:catabolite control protein A [Lentilactobacillus buchneri]|uniref:Catabolite control protein A n=1 Tax=Lentilactobacillus buchneri DSM 20057 TaxID=1423728 RepID=A0A4R5NP38_LENBU|nr:catabolite control protein A [Lentilactobacillus buchneri]KRK68601.1 global transcriptional regulator, catabolite control protein A [Lentilactobacillus buchneri DSM 20057]MCT3252982.1 catabolite control protein A [Lentilactobacillus buchneri]MCT3547576.1 catabolite control protein A [Lentilactobacillus buchneri]MCT4437978.1 catabolite control protein A [Lentilactobacillus buchneri]MQM70396.1 catabolite control protein A [Lentilactobacillus buchneri]